ncbi:hypothetical protein FVP74_01525 [Microbacterium saccharophilum]|uniref:Uncharacterized protein n=1 Tax=Microbacterium saccharophilum TaxID=1213358 RepID=A0A5C8I9X2_9MICO|nr:hypothetical protein [Microbacterium saccharophilum]TXK15132.1 hypothetical protein FVP74_01525 [Microbacterium saccharophilum]GEP47543.1 hypothetical protein MSA03_10510 [Microbacterium saccharophilum]
MNRTLNVIRMQLVNRQTYIWVPLLVLAGSFVLTLAIYGILANAGVATAMYGGGAQAPLWYFAVVGAQALTRTFPFSQAMSVTRREFYVGTMLTAALTSAILALVFVLGGLLEKATGGWGLNGYFFYLPWIWEGGPAVAGLFFFALAMLSFAVGFWGATIFKRWGNLVLTAVIVGLALVFVGLLWLAGSMNAWADMFVWFATQGALGLGLWSLLVIAVLAAISYLTLRRATP